MHFIIFNKNFLGGVGMCVDDSRQMTIRRCGADGR